MQEFLIVIPVHNAVELTLDCLKSLSDSGHSMSDVLIVDNGSVEGTCETLKLHHPEVQVIRGPNRGYGSAANIGITHSVSGHYKYTWLLNSDTLIDSNAGRELARFMELVENRRVGACSPIIYRADNPTAVDFAGGWLNRSNWSVAHISDPRSGAEAMVCNPTQTFLTGCAIFIRNEAAVDVGMFDERFFMYWEDCDFSIRLANGGWALRLAPQATILHRMQGSISGDPGRSAISIYYETRNCFLLWRQYTYGFFNRATSALRMLRWIVTTFIGRRFSSIGDPKQAAVEGVVDGLAGRFGPKQRCLTKGQAQVIAVLLWYVVLPLRLISTRK